MLFNPIIYVYNLWCDVWKVPLVIRFLEEVLTYFPRELDLNVASAPLFSTIAKLIMSLEEVCLSSHCFKFQNKCNMLSKLGH